MSVTDREVTLQDPVGLWAGGGGIGGKGHRPAASTSSRVTRVMPLNPTGGSHINASCTTSLRESEDPRRTRGSGWWEWREGTACSLRLGAPGGGALRPQSNGFLVPPPSQARVGHGDHHHDLRGVPAPAAPGVALRHVTGDLAGGSEQRGVSQLSPCRGVAVGTLDCILPSTPPPPPQAVFL